MTTPVTPSATCNQCGAELSSPVIAVHHTKAKPRCCVNPACPNFALVQIAAEDMDCFSPLPQKDDSPSPQ